MSSSCTGSGGDKGVVGGQGFSSTPQSSAKGGYLYLDFLAGEAGPGDSSSPSLFLDGDLNRPLSQHDIDLISCSLLFLVLSSTQSWISPLFPCDSSSPWSDGTPGFISFLSSSPKVNLLILLRLNSALLFNNLSSPHLCTSTASRICLVKAVLVNLTGLRWNLGSPTPPWWIRWCLFMWESSCLE